MLEIRTIKNNDLLVVEKLLRDHNQIASDLYKCINTTMAVYDQNEIIATAGFIQSEIYALVKFVVVKKDRQMEYIGDGLLKALLNMAEKNGIKRVFVYPKQTEAFFLKIGFNVLDLDGTDLIHTIFPNEYSNEKLLEATLSEIFAKACRSNH